MDARHRELIENIIKQNPNFIGHEHLMDKFCSEVYKKSYLLLDAVSNIESLRNYLNKVADTSIVNIIKSNGGTLNHIGSAQVEQTKSNEQNAQEQSSEDISQDDILACDDELSATFSDDDKKVEKIEINNPYEGLIDPLEFFPERTPSPVLAKNIAEALYRLDSKEPAKKYLDIFKMRYIDKCEQSLIAKRLKLSKSDLSKRFCEMVKYIRQQIL